eukprot:TRINITY_DN61822_c0_g1_i1.p1 TRINITY_DN61822_c0_g1~~TRINITY_DN61822_c0_g1_i1.p1  ORF type:complete len:423 (-),score=108.27 TRINITY_DN61822_c0_g1_i1:462-1700(-)
MPKVLPTDEFAVQPDQEEAEQGKEILEEKNKKRVRYWWEEGYVPGNEKDSDEEEEAEDKEEVEEEPQLPPDTNVLPSLDPAEDEAYEDVVPGDFRGGRRMRWGGLHGRLCLEDGDLALQDGYLAVEDGDDEVLDVIDDQPRRALPSVQDYLDELLLPAADIEAQEKAQAEAIARFAIEDAGSASAAETTAIVLYQTAESHAKPWSFCTVSDHMSKAENDKSEMRKMYAIEDMKPNMQLHSEQDQLLQQLAIGNYYLRQLEGQKVVERAKEDENIRRKQVKEGSREMLPGTKLPLAASQAWQDHRARSETGAVEGEGEAQPPKPQPSTKPPRQRKSLLPGSLSSSTGSASSSSASQTLPSPGLRKEQLPRARRQGAQAPSNSSLGDFGDFDDFEPGFRIPTMPLPKRMYRPPS